MDPEPDPSIYTERAILHFADGTSLTITDDPATIDTDATRTTVTAMTPWMDGEPGALAPLEMYGEVIMQRTAVWIVPANIVSVDTL